MNTDNLSNLSVCANPDEQSHKYKQYTQIAIIYRNNLMPRTLGRGLVSLYAALDINFFAH